MKKVLLSLAMVFSVSSAFAIDGEINSELPRATLWGHTASLLLSTINKDGGSYTYYSRGDRITVLENYAALIKCKTSVSTTEKMPDLERCILVSKATESPFETNNITGDLTVKDKVAGLLVSTLKKHPGSYTYNSMGKRITVLQYPAALIKCEEGSFAKTLEDMPLYKSCVVKMI